MEDQEEKRKRQKKGGDDKGNQSTQFIAAREAQIQKLKETEQIIKRRKLNLPQPQVGEAELEDIVKIGRSSRTALDLVGSSAEAGQASDKLIGEYDGLNKARMARTPMTAPQGELVYWAAA
jgi:pre-mRNA-splicing factor CDC5/CEF1